MIMQYRKDKNGNEISVLGYGCMRFTKEGGHADIDKAEKEVMAAIDAGVNYLDTAYVYSGNETAVGEILARNHCRERIYLATKLPHYLIKSVEGAQKMFEEELRRLQTDYIDYYLMHMLTDLPTWEKLKKLGMEDWIREKKASGQIRNIGFSYHGRSDMFMQLIDAYDWDLYGRTFAGGRGGTALRACEGDSGDYHGAAARRQAGQSAAGVGEGTVRTG